MRSNASSAPVLETKSAPSTGKAFAIGQLAGGRRHPRRPWRSMACYGQRGGLPSFDARRPWHAVDVEKKGQSCIHRRPARTSDGSAWLTMRGQLESGSVPARATGPTAPPTPNRSRRGSSSIRPNTKGLPVPLRRWIVTEWIPWGCRHGALWRWRPRQDPRRAATAHELRHRPALVRPQHCSREDIRPVFVKIRARSSTAASTTSTCTTDAASAISKICDGWRGTALNNILMTFEHGEPVLTPFFQEFLDEVKGFGARLVFCRHRLRRLRRR